jgi:NAD(P)H-dependent flavin oxidoreductase YrpB (nitropropane dioxygenase family)
MLQDLIDGMPRLIQAGMGVRISGARLANATSRLGALGVVSGVGLRHIVIEELRAGNPEVAEAAQRFPLPRYVDELMAYAPGGAKHDRPIPMDHPDPARGARPKRLSAIAAFTEVVRARQGHRGKVGINVMWKCALTVLPTIYGAMLAGAGALPCGAGVPMELPGLGRAHGWTPFTRW